MKKKIILALTACLFATVTIINMHLAQNSHAMDVSLADISVMAQADGESGHSVTYDCYDAHTYSETNDGQSFHQRVCENTLCGWAYFDSYGQIAKCTVNY